MMLHIDMAQIVRQRADNAAHREAIAEGAPEVCTWLVEVPNGNPEPTCREDAYTIRDCGWPVRYDAGGFRCSVGHDHRTYGGIDHQEYFDADEMAGGRY